MFRIKLLGLVKFSMLLSTYLILACASLKNYGKKWKVSQDPQKIMLNIGILI